MPKLHLKRTPKEEEARRWRRQKRNKTTHNGQDSDLQSTSACRGTTSSNRDEPEISETRPWASSDEEPEIIPSSHRGHHPPSNKPHDAVRDDEEQQFRQRMFDALQDDERLDYLETRLNDFAHVPDRWRSDHGPKLPNDGYGTDDIFQLDPQHMDDEEYAEWIRLGMYRRTHAKEYAERERKRCLKAARRAEEAAHRAETKKLQRASEERRNRKKIEREMRQREAARVEYDARWKELFSRSGGIGRDTALKFSDIPWPILVAHPQACEGSSVNLRPVTLEDLTAKDISDFLFATSSISTIKMAEPEKKQRKEILKETLLRFHPDKFEGRFMKQINQDERNVVKEAIGQVVRALNTLMDEVG